MVGCVFFWLGDLFGEEVFLCLVFDGVLQREVRVFVQCLCGVVWRPHVHDRVVLVCRV